MSNNEDATANATGTGGAGNSTGRTGGGTAANTVGAAMRVQLLRCPAPTILRTNP